MLSLVTCETRRRLSPGTHRAPASVEPGPVTGAALPGSVRLSRAASETRDHRRETGGVRGQAGTGGPSPDVTRALTSARPLVTLCSASVSGVTRPVSCPRPNLGGSVRVSRLASHHPGPGTLIGDIRGQATLATLARATNERRWRGHTGPPVT